MQKQLDAMPTEISSRSPEPDYLRSIRAAMALLQEATRHAVAALPAAIRREHDILAQHETCPWMSLGWKYPQVAALDALAEIAVCVGKLEGVLLRAEAANRPADLRLRKWRREEDTEVRKWQAC